MCRVTGAVVLRCYATGLRLYGRRPGEAWSAVSEPLGEEWETAGNVEGFGVLKRRRRAIHRGGESARDELAERAIVFLVDARTAGVPMIFDVGTRRGHDCIAGLVRIDDADDARQNRLRERGDEDPTTDETRNATTHSVVSFCRGAREILAQYYPSAKSPRQTLHWYVQAP
jgi:hypothetical protein